MTPLRAFSSAATAGEAVAAAVADRLEAALRERGAAALAVPGGRTPGLFLANLFSRPLNWAAVVIVPTDDRRVPPDSPDSNLGTLTALMAGRPAAAARRLALVHGRSTAAEDCAAALVELERLDTLFDAVVLGMGEDGHVASLFPGQSIADTACPPCVPGLAPGPPRSRISLSLPRLLATRSLFLLAGGERKRAVLERACNGGGDGLPVSAIVRHAAVPFEIFWYEEP